MRMQQPPVFALALLPLLLPRIADAAQDFPKMHAGLWKTTTVTQSADPANPSTPHVSSICLDASVQQLMVQFSQGLISGICSKHDLRVSGSTVESDSVCDLMGSRTTTHSTMKFSGDTRYHADAHTTYEPAAHGRTQSDTAIDGKYVGPCPAGMSPGDLTLPNGKMINVKSFAETMKTLSGGK